MNGAPAPRTREQLIARYRDISKSLADERLSEVERAPLRTELEGVRGELEAIERTLRS